MFKPYEGTEPYIFVSYASENKHIIYPVLEAMDRVGYRVWYNKGVHLATEWRESIAEHVDNCAVFIAFHSTASLKSKDCKAEIEYAISKGTLILSVFLEDVELSRGLQMYLHKLQTIDFDGAEELLNSLDGEPAFEHCRKPRQENSAVPQKPEVSEKQEAPQKPEVTVKTEVLQKPEVTVKTEVPQKPEVAAKTEVPQKSEVPAETDVPPKQEVPQKPDNVQSKMDTQHKENTKRTPPKDPKKPLLSKRSELIRKKRKGIFDACRARFNFWGIIALIALALTILAYYADETHGYFKLGIVGCIVIVLRVLYVFAEYLEALGNWERVRNKLSTMAWYVTRDGVLTILNAGESDQGIIYSDYMPDDGRIYSNDEHEWVHIQSVIIKPGISEIYDYAFLNYTHLTSVEIPESVKKIHSLAFENCNKLESVMIPSGTDCERYAFPLWINISRK